MAFERTVEAIIREAMERGEFQNLPGKGKPLDLTAYFEAPEETRVVLALLRNAGVAPREVGLLEEIQALRRQEGAEADTQVRTGLRQRIARLQLELDLRVESRHRDGVSAAKR